MFWKKLTMLANIISKESHIKNNISANNYSANDLECARNCSICLEDDVSLKGKLGLLHFDLANGESIVEMHVAVVHEVNEEIGLQCNAIDIDSISLVRRLIELNLGDDGQINKELSQLTRSPD